jgi:hypothetical protein
MEVMLVVEGARWAGQSSVANHEHGIFVEDKAALWRGEADAGSGVRCLAM